MREHSNRRWGSYVAVASTLALWVTQNVMAIEKARYTVLEKAGEKIELRRYAPQIVAETLVSGDF